MRLALSTIVIVACSNAGGAGGGGGGGGCNGGAGDLTFTDENNYEFANTVAMNAIEVQPQSDFAIDWSGLTTDVRDRPVDPATVEEISILRFAHPLDALVGLFAQNAIAQVDARDMFLFPNSGVTSAPASAFSVTAQYLDLGYLVEDPESTWVVSAVNYPGGRLDLLQSVAVLPTAGSTNTTVELNDGDTQLTIDTLELNVPPLTTTAGEGSYSLDWSAVTVDVFGHAFNSQAGDELLIGHYDGTIEDIEANFLQLDTYASEIYRATVRSETKLDDLSEAADESNKSFEGFTTDGTWLIGITCTTCSTPVPLLLTVVEVTEEE